MCGVNFPLFTYSVLAKENVSQKSKNIFEGQQQGVDVCRPGQMIALRGED